MQESTFAQLETMFLALGDKTRLRLLALMADGPVAVGFLADRLKESQPKVSRHLAYLRNAGMVTTARDGKWVYYGIKYSRDAAQRRILEGVISSITVMRIDGSDVYLADSDFIDEPTANIYEDAYIDSTESSSSTNDGNYDGGGSTNDGELDVFML